jgi:hypothetical protein
LLDAFVESADGLAGRSAEFSEQLAAASGMLIGAGRQTLAKALDELSARLEPRGFPAVHHSQSYTEAYRPAYRVVLLEIAKERGWCPGSGAPDTR